MWAAFFYSIPYYRHRTATERASGFDDFRKVHFDDIETMIPQLRIDFFVLRLAKQAPVADR